MLLRIEKQSVRGEMYAGTEWIIFSLLLPQLRLLFYTQVHAIIYLYMYIVYYLRKKDKCVRESNFHISTIFLNLIS